MEVYLVEFSSRRKAEISYNTAMDFTDSEFISKAIRQGNHFKTIREFQEAFNTTSFGFNYVIRFI